MSVLLGQSQEPGKSFDELDVRGRSGIIQTTIQLNLAGIIWKVL